MCPKKQNLFYFTLYQSFGASGFLVAIGNSLHALWLRGKTEFSHGASTLWLLCVEELILL